MDSTAPPSGRTAPPLRRPVAQRRALDDASARLLLAGTPRQVLARIVPGDPLGVRARCAARLRARALFADVDRLLVRAQARAAREACRWHGRPALTAWLDARVDEALDDLADALDVPPPGDDSPLAVLARPLGLSPRAMAAACRSFNALDEDTRRAFFALVVDACPLEEAAHRAGQPALELARRARRALDVFRAAAPAPLPPTRHRDPQPEEPST